MVQCLQASTYTTAEFRIFLNAYFEIHPCVLCNEVHPPCIHGYAPRLIRDPERYENIEILICVVICRKAQQRGIQYTKRMLPPFVIPHCNITLEAVVRMYRHQAGGRIDCDVAGAHLGTLCEKTVHRHMAMIEPRLEQAIIERAGVLAAIGPFVAFPEAHVDEGLWSLYLGVSAAVDEAERLRSGRQGVVLPETWHLHRAYLVAPGLKKPSSLSSVRRDFFDTS